MSRTKQSARRGRGGRGGRRPLPTKRGQRERALNAGATEVEDPEFGDAGLNSKRQPYLEPKDRRNAALEEYYATQHIVAPGELAALLGALATPLPTSFRVSANSRFRDDVIRKLETEFSSLFTGLSIANSDEPVVPPARIRWYPGGLAWTVTAPRFLVRRNNILAPFHRFLVQMNDLGAINRQEAVSMIPPLLLDMKPGQSIIDLCAAPGSKSAQLLEALSTSPNAPHALSAGGLVIANDADISRCWMLAHQLRRFGAPNLMVTHHDAQSFPAISSFDRVLCDVPCTGDGTLRKAPDLWRRWTPQLGNGIHRLQKNILRRGIELLKPGGRLVYSTCSMNPVENEAVVADALRCLGPGVLELVDVSDELPSLKRRTGLCTWKVKDTAMCSLEDDLGNEAKAETNAFSAPRDLEAAHEEEVVAGTISGVNSSDAVENCRLEAQDEASAPPSEKITRETAGSEADPSVQRVTSEAPVCRPGEEASERVGTNAAYIPMDQNAQTSNAEELLIEQCTGSTGEQEQAAQEVKVDNEKLVANVPETSTVPEGRWFTKFDEVPDRRRRRVISSLFPPSAEELESGHFPLERCLRLLPLDQDTGAFFVAVLVKKEGTSDSTHDVHDATMAEQGHTAETAETFAVPLDSMASGLRKSGEEFDEGHEVSKNEGFGDGHEVGKNEGQPDPAPKSEKKGREQRGHSRLITDDPLCGLEHRHEDVLLKISEFFGLDEKSCRTCLMTRGSEDARFKRVLVVSPAVREMLKVSVGSPEGEAEGRRRRLRVVNAGVRVFERTRRRDAAVPFRILSDGIEILRRSMSKRVVHVSQDDLKKMLTTDAVEILKFKDRETRLALDKMSAGSALMVQGSGVETEVLLIWKGTRTITKLMPGDELRAMRERHGLSVLKQAESGGSGKKRGHADGSRGGGGGGGDFDGGDDGDGGDDSGNGTAAPTGEADGEEESEGSKTGGGDGSVRPRAAKKRKVEASSSRAPADVKLDASDGQQRLEAH